MSQKQKWLAECKVNSYHEVRLLEAMNLRLEGRYDRPNRANMDNQEGKGYTETTKWLAEVKLPQNCRG